MFGPFVSEAVIRLFKILKMFYPRRDCDSRTEGGPFDSLSILLCLRNGFDTFIIPIFSMGLFEILKMFYLRMDGMGWDGWMEYQKFPSNFFILCGYIEKVYTFLYM